MKKANIYYICAICLAILGFALFAVDVAKGNAKAGILLIIPFIMGGGIYSLLGIICIIGAFILFYFGMVKSAEALNGYLTGGDADTGGQFAEPDSAKTGKEKRFGGVILIGPIPVIFGSDKKSMIIAVALAAIFLIITFILLIFILRFW